MKKMILALVWIPLVALVSCRNNKENQIKNNQVMQSTQEQKEGILRAIDLYVEAGRKGDSKIAVAAFAPTATVSWTENGELKSAPIQALFDFFDSAPSEVSYELTTLDVAEDAAIVRIESQFGPAKFADMFTLVKDGSDWKIVSKVYHTK